jgi:hypothetical protein
MTETGRSTDRYEACTIQDLLTTAQTRSLVRQFDSLDHVPRELSALIEPTSLRAKIGEFLRPGAGTGIGSPLFVWAPITSSRCLGEDTWHAFEVLVGQRPGVAILVAVNEAECPVHASAEDLSGLLTGRRAPHRRSGQQEMGDAPELSGP